VFQNRVIRTTFCTQEAGRNISLKKPAYEDLSDLLFTKYYNDYEIRDVEKNVEGGASGREEKSSSSSSSSSSSVDLQLV
jgi:hypothetical protein